MDGFLQVVSSLGAGALIGSLVTHILNKWSEDRRWKREDDLREEHQKREDRNRYNAERRRVYARFGGTVLDLVTEPNQTKSVDLNELLFEVRLLSNYAVQAEATQVLTALRQYLDVLEQRGPVQDEHRDQVWKAVGDFEAAARREMGVEEG